MANRRRVGAFGVAALLLAASLIAIDWLDRGRGPPLVSSERPPREGIRTSGPSRRVEHASAESDAGTGVADTGPLDPSEKERQAFMTRLRVADARQGFGEIIPMDVARAIGAGRFREAVNRLLEMGRDGDANAYAALGGLLRICPGPGSDPAFEQRALERQYRNDQMIEQARRAGAPEDIARRLRWSLDAANAHRRGVWSELCPARGEGDYEALQVEAESAVPPYFPPDFWQAARGLTGANLNEFMKERQPILDARMQANADLGLVEAQIAIAGQQLSSDDARERAAAAAVLRALAPVSSQALVVLAMCLERRCIDEDDPIEEARELYLQAARAGNMDALGFLARAPRKGGESAVPLESERYAWAQVRHELVAAGCYGFTGFYTWAFRERASRHEALLAMSPSAARQAEQRARELVDAEVPGIRAALGCD